MWTDLFSRSPATLTLGAFLCAVALPLRAELRLVFETTTGRADRISFQSVGLPGAPRTSQYATNPVINGDNLYAPDLVRSADGWFCYYGGWKTAGQLYDRIYLGTRLDLEVGGAWSEQMIISNGIYEHVNDPTVVRDNGTWIMLYTAARWIESGTGRQYRDWINYSTSGDGITWTPDAGTSSTEISITDPASLLQGETLSDIARPSLVRDGSKWKLWFDGKINGGSLASYLAESGSPFPSTFHLVHKYPDAGNFPGFMEPDVVRLPDGTFAAVIQRNFNKLLYGASTDGIGFALQEAVDADHPFFPRKWISNPGLVYDEQNGKVLGLAYGMTDSDALTDHDIGFGAMHYQVEVRSPGEVWHVFSEAHSLDEISVMVFNYTDFDLVRVRNPVTGEVTLTQPFTEARPGDLWKLTGSAGVGDPLRY